MQSTIAELTRSLEFTQHETDDLSRKVNQQQRELREKDQVIEELSEKLKASEVHSKDLYERCIYQDDYNRRNNLQFVGIEKKQGSETWEQSAIIASMVLEEQLQLRNIQLERDHQVGQQVDHRPRPIMGLFTRFSDREAVLRNLCKLKESRSFLNEDLCPASHNIRKAQLPALKAARSQGKIAAYF